MELDSRNIIYLDLSQNISESVESRLEAMFNLCFFVPAFLDGVKAFRENQIDLMIINLDESKAEGIKFLKLVKSKQKNFPTMIISEKDDAELNKQIKTIKVDAILQPPITEEALMSRIEGIKDKILKFAMATEQKAAGNKLKESLSIEQSIDTFFKKTLVELTRYDKTDKFDRKMDFSIMKSFLYTAFNNFKHMDPAFEDEQLSFAKARLEDAVKMQYDLERRIGYAIETNYENIFLKKQIPYVEMLDEFAATKEKVEKARNELAFFTRQLEELREKIKKYPKESPEFKQLERDVKRTNGKHVDRVHNIKEWKEVLEGLDEKMKEFRKAHFEDFKKVFFEKTEDIKKDIKSALDILAYKFDRNIWRRAKKSRNIREFFAQARIKGLFSSKTYLEYYVGNLDKKMVGAQNAKLIKYLDEYNKVNKLLVAVLGADTTEVTEDKYFIEGVDPCVQVQGFINDDLLLKKFGEQYFPVIVVYYHLSQGTAFHFIKKFKEKHGDDFNDVTFVLKYGRNTRKNEFMNAVGFGFRHFVQEGTPRETYVQLMLDAL